MKIIEQQAHFWELYQDDEHYYLSIAIDLSSVVSCWYVHLTQTEIDQYRKNGRDIVDDLTHKMVQCVYRGNFSELETRQVSDEIQQAMLIAYQNQG